jgi:hypothetical protein
MIQSILSLLLLLLSSIDLLLLSTNLTLAALLSIYLSAAAAVDAIDLVVLSDILLLAVE